MIGWLNRVFGGAPSPAAPAAAPTARLRQPAPPPVLTAEDLRGLAQRCGYGEAGEELVALTAPVFHIIAGSDASDAPLGETRLGGAPDLPVGSTWPKGRFGLATFLAQFNLADVAARTGSDLLPSSGLLSLFVVEIESAADPVEVLSIVTPAGTPQERLQPPADTADFADHRAMLTPVSVAGFQPGISLSLGDMDRLQLDARYPDGDMVAFVIGLTARPKDAVGEWLGRGFDGHDDDQRQVAHSRCIGRPNLERYAFITSWEEWLELKMISHPLPNGTVYRPWQDRHDPEVRWLLDNRAAFDAGVEALRLLVRIESNPKMDLWINDADPIYILIDEARMAEGDLSQVHATVTQG